MKIHTEFYVLLKEVFNLISKFVKPCGLTDKMVVIPEEVRKFGIKSGLLNLTMTTISVVFAFLLKFTNCLIEMKLILLGMIIFILYRSQEIVRDGLFIIQNAEGKKFDMILEDQILLRGSQIIGYTANRVLKYDSSNKLYRLLSNEEELKTIKRYLTNLWRQKVYYIFDFGKVICVILMLVTAILTNTAIDPRFFNPLLIIFTLLSFFTSAYISLNRKSYYHKDKRYDNRQYIIGNDLLRVPAIVKNDLDMRIAKLQEAVNASRDNVLKFHNKINFSRLFLTITEVLSQYGIIILFIVGIEWNSISLATITEITATLVIIQSALQQIRQIADTIDNNNERISVIENEQEDMLLILEVYYKERERVTESQTIESIDIEPFSIKYLEESENDKPFRLISKKSIHIDREEICVLYGPSGSGKSTFMKMLTGQIRLEKNTEIPSTTRFMFFDEKLKFGSMNIYDELFCCNENPDLDKMQVILENLHLWNEIKSQCMDIWQWMKEKRFEQSLSHGQKQRLIIAKMLYWLDNSIDIVVLDECTSGLDDKVETDSADAERILEYVVRYVNEDKKRIVIISTHQNIDGMKEKISDKFKFRNFQFVKENERNLVKEI